MARTTSRPALAVVADVHIDNHRQHGGELFGGVNARAQLVLDALASALAHAQAEDVPTFVVAGDLFHVKRPDPGLIAATARVLATGMEIVLVPGNHDSLDSVAGPGRTAMAPLWTHGAVVSGAGDGWQLITTLSGIVLGCVPFRSDVPMADVLAAALPAMRREMGRSEILVLIAHAGLYDDGSPSWMRGSPDAVHAKQVLALMRDSDVRQAFFGHYHQHRRWGGDSLVQVGTLAPTGHSDDGMFPDVGGMALWGPSSKLVMVEIPGPRFFTVRTPEDRAKLARYQGSGSAYHVRAQASEVARLASDPGLLVEELPPEEPDIPARGATLLDAQDAREAIRAYALSLPRPEGVDADELVQRAFEFWEAAQS